MLFKKIKILKGAYGEGVLKATFLEGAYTKIEISVPMKSGACAIVADGVAEVVPLERGKLEKRLPYLESMPQICVMDDSGVIYGDRDEKCISLLLPEDGTASDEYENHNNEKEEAAIEIEATEKDVSAEGSAKEDIALQFGVEELAPETSKREENGFLADFEERYASSAREETLETLFPGSKWIKSDDDKTAIGVLYNSSGATHFCYAEKGVREEPPSYNAEWVDGYWVVYNEI